MLRATASVSIACRLEHREQLGIVDDDADRAARDRRHAAEHRQPHELRPDVDGDVGAERRLKTGGPAGLEQPLEPRRARAVQLAEDQVIHRRVADDARLGDHRRHVRDAAARVPCADGTRQHLDAVDAVLKRDHDRVGTDERRQQCQRALGVVQLDREEDDVDRTDRRGVVGGADAAEGGRRLSGSRCGGRACAARRGARRARET